MLIGVPKEIKDNENRVGMIPSTVNALIKLGHQVLVEKGAGEGSATDFHERPVRRPLAVCRNRRHIVTVRSRISRSRDC